MLCDLGFHDGDAKVRECCFIILLQVLTWYTGIVEEMEGLEGGR